MSYPHPYDGNPDPDRARYHESQLLQQELEGNRWCRQGPMRETPPLPPCTTLCQECRVQPATERHIYQTRLDEGTEFKASLSVCDDCTTDRIFNLPRPGVREVLKTIPLPGLWLPCFVCEAKESTFTWRGVHDRLKSRDFRLCGECVIEARWSRNWTFTVRGDD
jgi:hypothetical protein